MKRMTSHTHLDHRKQQGFVMVTILWMLAILTVLILGFGHRALLERRMAWYELDRAQAQAMARGAVQRAVLELENKRHLDTLYKKLGYTGLDQHWAQPVNLMTESDYFVLSQDEAFAEDVCTYTIVDCERFISINDAPREIIESLDLFDFTVIDALLDARTPEEGAQSARLLDADAIFDLEEASSIDEGLWYGTEDTQGIRPLLTLYGSPEDGRVNINTASREVLERIPKLPEAVLDEIMVYRNGVDGLPYTVDDRAFSSIRDIRKHLSTSFSAFTPIQKYCKTESQWFKITGHATRRQGKINAYYSVIVELKRNNVIIRQWKEGIVAQ